MLAIQKERLAELDILRTAAFLGVVGQHILGAYARRTVQISADAKLTILLIFELLRFAVPMFVFLFAFILFKYSYGSFKYRPYLLKRTKQLILPYFIWSILYMLYDCFIKNSHPSPVIFIKQLAHNLLLGGASYHLWYVVMIFQFVVFTPVLIYVFSLLTGHSDTKLTTALNLLLFVSFCLAYLKFSPYINFNHLTECIFIKYRSLNFISWLLFFGFGALAGRYSQKFCAISKRLFPYLMTAYIASILYAFSLDFTAVLLTCTVNFSNVSFLNPLYAVFTLFGLISIFHISRYLRHNKAISKLTAFVGKYSYQAYLSHALFISIFSSLLQKTSLAKCLPLFYLILFSSSSAAAVLCGFLIENNYIKRKLSKHNL